MAGIKKTFPFAGVIILLLVALVAGWFYFHHKDSLEVVAPIRGKAVQAAYATGTVEPSVMMPVAPRITARLQELYVDEGQNVTKGQVLARLEDDTQRHTITELQAKEAFAKNEFERNALLVKERAASKTDYDRSKSNWDAAQAATHKAQAELEYTRLVAPEDGYIIKRDGEVGELISDSQPLFWMSCCAPLRVSAEVDEEDIPSVKMGQTVLIRADAFPGQVFRGTVQSITPKGDPIARSYRVRVLFSEETPLLIGMTAETNIILREEANALLIPATAVWQDKVWVVKGNKLRRVTVSVGAKDSDQAEIVSGLTEQDRIVRHPSPEMTDGMAVTPVLTVWGK